jgi:hypothetical protein
MRPLQLDWVPSATASPRFGERFDAAMKEIRSNKIVARRNIASCCRGCYDPNVSDDQPIIWHFGGQGNHMDVYDDGAYYRYTRYNAFKPVSKIHFNHSGLVTAGQLTPAGQTVLDVFARHGLVVEWDRNNLDCITVNVQASLAPNFKYE